MKVILKISKSSKKVSIITFFIGIFTMILIKTFSGQFLDELVNIFINYDLIMRIVLILFQG